MLQSDKRVIPDKGFTHAGQFHADDVFSTALLKMLNPDIKIERGFKVPDNYDGIVFDIGLGEFDHHQKDNEIRENDIPYASFGKLWRAFGDRLVSERAVESIDKTLIQSLDDSDNTGHYNPLSIVISQFNPTWDSEIQSNDAFDKAVNIATTFLENTIEQERSKDLAKDIVDKAVMQAVNKEVVILPRFVPSIDYLIDTEAKFVIFPSNRGGYNIQVIPAEHGDPAAKIDLPAEWAGQTGLDKISNIDDLTFCHTAKFLASTNTIEGAIKVAVTALNGKSEYSNDLEAQFNEINNSLNNKDLSR